MPILPEIAALAPEMKRWRHHIHAHPETAFEEHATAKYVADLLRSFGLEVHEGLAGTGVVARLTCGGGSGAIGLRADLDALHILEQSGVPYASKNPGKMHACGHDGHTSMLLGAAKALSARGAIDGTVYFVFQPAEENEGGARVMVEEGLFANFPMRAVYGLHNWPGMPFGRMAARVGPLMAAYDIFEVVITGQGFHAAMPHWGKDPMILVSQLIAAFQTIVSRDIDPVDAGVVSVTQVHGGDTWNVVPNEVVVRGTVRTFRTEVQDTIERRMRTILAGLAASFEMQASLRYERRYPALVNSVDETGHALAAATALLGPENVERNPTPAMSSEDFAYMLQAKPGCYVWLGTGRGSNTPNLHNPRYDFNDQALTVGASYWVTLAEQQLGVAGADRTDRQAA